MAGPLKKSFLILFILFLIDEAKSQIHAHQDPNHKIVFENESIRLLDGQVMANDTTQAHLHALNSIVVFLTKSMLGIETVGEKPVITQVNPGDIIYRAYGDSPVNHKVWAQGESSDLRFLVIELKMPLRSTDCPGKEVNELKLKWEKRYAKGWLLDIAAGKSFAFEKESCIKILINIEGELDVKYKGKRDHLTDNSFLVVMPHSDLEVTAKSEHVRSIILQF